MRKYILKVIAFSLLLISTFLFVLSRADGNSDEFYLRFSSPKQTSLILGNSRASQGVLPSIFKQEMDLSIFNYSFTLSHSPYGPVYYHSILKKLDTNQNNGIFIITVDPWSISSQTIDPNDTNSFRENELSLARTSCVNCSPNFQFLLHTFSGRYFELLSHRKTFSFLHSDGWLEVSVGMDSNSVKKRKDIKIADYNNLLKSYKLSSVRLKYLKKIILKLNDHGKVYLVRLPVHKEMLAIEKQLMPEFDNLILELSLQTGGYFNMTELNNNYKYTDGNHLYKESSRKATKEITSWIEKGIN